VLTAPTKKEELAKLYAETEEASKDEKHLYDDVECFCLFVGSGRSGHSLVGSLLDAHPEIIVAHQLNVLQLVRANFTRLQIYHLLLANSRHYAEHGREETGYSYAVPRQWQGMSKRLRVIGDKSGAATETRLRFQPWLLEKLDGILNVPVKLIHAIRNPYDNISTVAKRREFELPDAIDRYFGRCDTVLAVMERTPAEDIFETRHEDFVADPKKRLADLCAFLGVGAPADYLDACAAIVSEQPHRSRQGTPWTGELVESVAERMKRYPFLSGYSFEG
jgi:hypothetical protein